jgi:PAS domain S-box-containing protein
MPAFPLIHPLRRLRALLRQGFARIVPRPERPSAGDLRAREQRLRLALTAAGLGVFEHLLRDHRILVTPEFCLIFGLPVQTSLPQDKWIERVHPDDRILVHASIQQMLDKQAALDFEHRVCLPAGGVRWVHTMAAPISVNGTVESIHGVVQDITARRQAESRLRQFSRAVEQSPVSVLITDAQGRIEYVNPKFCQVTGYDFAEVLGKTPGLLNSGDLPVENYQQMWAAIKAGVEWHGESHNRKKNGVLYWESASISPVRDADGNITHFIAVIEDITTGKQAALELAEAKQFLDRIIETVGDPIFVKDHQHRFAVVNTSLCNMVHRRRQDLLGQTDRDFFPKEEVEKFWARDEQIFNTGTESIHEETLTDADGRVHTIVTRKNLHRNEHGELFLVGVIHDITERKLAVQKLVDSKNFLDRIINTVGEPIYVLDRQHRWVEMNGANCDLLGRQRQELLGKTLHDVLPQAEADALLAMDDLVFQTGKESVHEERITDAAGHAHTILTRRNLYRNETGEMFLVGTLHDITQNKQLEAALRQSEHLQNEILDNIPDPAWLKDQQGRFLAVNKSMRLRAGVFGHTLEKAAGHTTAELAPQYATEFVKQDQQVLLSGKSACSEESMTDPEGKTHWFEIIRSPIFGDDGKLTGIAGIARDITERQRAAQELAESKQFNDRIIETVGDPIFVKDQQHRFAVVNSALCHLLHRQRQDLLGRTDWDFFPKEESEVFWARDEQIFTTGIESIHEESLTDADGRIHTIVTRKNLHRNDHGELFLVGVIHDITDRRQTETALRESEEKFRQLADNIADVFWMTSPDLNTMLYVSAGYEAVWGRSREQLYADPEQWVQAILPADRERAAAAFAALLNGEATVSVEYQIARPDGAVRWIHDRGFRVRDEQGKLVRIAGIARDITERKRTEQLLSQSEARFRGYFELGAVGMTISSISSLARGSLDLNDHFCQMLGYTREELLKMSWSDYTLADDLVDEIANLNRVLAGECDGYSMDKRYIRKDGRIVFATISVKCVRRADGLVDHLMSVVQDITERKQAETALRESEEKFRQLADNIADVFWITSPDLKAIHYVSAGYEIIWGLSRESLYAHPHQWVEAILPGERDRVFAAFASLMNGEAAVSVEYRIARPDGSVRWIHDRGFQVLDEQGKLVRIAGIASDITDQKHSAQQLAQLKEEEEGVRLELEREHALSQVKSRFVSLVSHEFRTPLSAINMAAFLLSDYAEGMSAEERAAHTRDIQNAVGRMTAMMEDFLVHEQVQSGGLKCQPARLNLELFCRELIPEVQHALSPLRLIECTIDPAVREVFLDERILRHILGNLLSNAVKYSGEGQTVTFTARRLAGRTPSPDLPETSPEDQLQLKITDSGIGIPEADLPKLFHTFHRAPNVGNRPGSGMGLAIVKQFVDLHRGIVRVESKEGKGTTVCVWLPLGPAAAVVPPAVAGALPPPGPNSTPAPAPPPPMTEP